MTLYTLTEKYVNTQFPNAQFTRELYLKSPNLEHQK